jgi:hypothetical protein
VADQRSDEPGTSSRGGAGLASDSAEIGWLRAIGSGALIVLVGFLGGVVLPNLIVVQLDGLTTFTRSILAASLTIAVVVALAVVLRRLQGRRLI